MRRWRRGYSRGNIRWKAILLIVLFFVLIIMIDRQIRPIIESITTNQARIQSVDTINTAVAKELKENSVSYNDLITVERNDSGEVLAITTNMVKMNELKAIIIEDVQHQLGGTSILIPEFQLGRCLVMICCMGTALTCRFGLL